MNREQIIDKIKEKKYFVPQELVDKQTFIKYKHDSWQFISTELLHTLLVLRELIGKPFYLNNWHIGGDFDERVLRTNLCDIVQDRTTKKILYLSGHPLGMAADFTVKGMTADEVRSFISQNADKLPYKVRLEYKVLSTGKTITWVHIDVKWLKRNPKVYFFNI